MSEGMRKNVCLKFPRISCNAHKCRGEFISAGVVNQSAPVEVFYTKAELDEMVREGEEKLKKLNFPNDDDLVKAQSTKVVEEKVKEEFSPEDEDMGVRQPQRDNVDDDGAVMVDVSDESTSLSINFERLKVILIDDMVAPAFCIDPVDRISRYLLFKLADYVVNAYPPWQKYIFGETDIKRRKLLRVGSGTMTQEKATQL